MKVLHQRLTPDGQLLISAELGDELPEQIIIKHNNRLVVFIEAIKLKSESFQRLMEEEND